MIEDLNVYKLGRWSALLSFVIGTLLFLTFLIIELLWHLFYSSFIHSLTYSIVGMGLYFVNAAILINSIILLVILLLVVMKEHKRSYGLKTAGLILLNIPIALIYYLIVEVIF